MNTIYKNFKPIVILILLAVIVIMYATRPTPPDMSEYIRIGGKEYLLLSSKRDTVWETKEVKVPTYVPQLPPNSQPIPMPIPKDVDTVAILQKYYSKNVYVDVQKIDEVGTVTISDTIAENKILSRQLLFNYKIPTITETIIVKDPPVNKMYIGGGVNVDQTDIVNSIYASTLFQTKSDRIFGINIGASTSENNSVKPYIGASIYWKIKFGKKNK